MIASIVSRLAVNGWGRGGGAAGMVLGLWVWHIRLKEKISQLIVEVLR